MSTPLDSLPFQQQQQQPQQPLPSYDQGMPVSMTVSSPGGAYDPTLGGQLTGPPQQQQGTRTMDELTIHEVVSGIQEASITGATTLPVRDFPRDQQYITHDQQVQPSYVPAPQPSQQNYIESNEYASEEAARAYKASQNYNAAFDSAYADLHIPVMLAVLYFIMQLPIVKKVLSTQFSSIVHVDGNYNLYGYLLTSVLFGGAYYALCKVLTYI